MVVPSKFNPVATTFLGRVGSAPADHRRNNSINEDTPESALRLHSGILDRSPRVDE